MPGRRRKSELFSPPGLGATISRINQPSPSDIISPSTQRQQTALSTLTNTPGSVFSPSTIINNDAKDKKERRRSKVLELQRRHISSPAAASPADRRKSMPKSGLSSQQLAEHYSSCIKLSAENKITSKNAFGLHLIDYMAELLRKKEMNNFQVASSTLDASAKIYAGRVDAIHSETYKVLSGLGRTGGSTEKQQHEHGDGEGAEAEDPEHREGERKRKRAKKSHTVETNLKNINMAKLDLEFEVDPLFSKTSAAFDEGGTGGLMMNHLQVLDDTSELVLDSNTIMSTAASTLTDSVVNKVVDMSEFKTTYCGVQLENLHICPSFQAFEFTNWSQDSQEEDGSTSMVESQSDKKQNEHAFDLEAEAEPIPSSGECTGLDSGGGGEFMDDFGNVGDDNEDNEAGSSGLDLSGLGGEEETKMVQHMMKDMKSGTISTLMQILAAEPSDYSYFNSKLLRTWAGPAHWKLKSSKSKDSTQFRGHLGGERGKRKEKKEPFAITCDEKIDFDAYFKERRRATTLTKGTIDKYNKSGTTLPEDLHYDADKLFKLFVKARMMLKRQHEPDGEDEMDEGVDCYDYDNPADAAEFCPGTQDDDDDDNEVGFDMTSSQDAAGSQGMDITQLSGDKLVQAPHKVAQLDINYAKQAKKTDMKKLKGSMWNLLVKPEKDKENATESEGPPSPVPADATVQEPHSFQKMVEVLPSQLSKTMASNLSVPIAFVCLLHLANEKCLSITSSPDMGDLHITQG